MLNMGPGDISPLCKYQRRPPAHNARSCCRCSDNTPEPQTNMNTRCPLITPSSPPSHARTSSTQSTHNPKHRQSNPHFAVWPLSGLSFDTMHPGPTHGALSISAPCPSRKPGEPAPKLASVRSVAVDMTLNPTQKYPCFEATPFRAPPQFLGLQSPGGIAVPVHPLMRKANMFLMRSRVSDSPI